jgi:hypothetical protein
MKWLLIVDRLALASVERKPGPAHGPLTALDGAFSVGLQ